MLTFFIFIIIIISIIPFWISLIDRKLIGIINNRRSSIIFLYGEISSLSELLKLSTKLIFNININILYIIILLLLEYRIIFSYYYRVDNNWIVILLLNSNIYFLFNNKINYLSLSSLGIRRFINYMIISESSILYIIIYIIDLFIRERIEQINSINYISILIIFMSFLSISIIERHPFDVPESESELSSGFIYEFSSIYIIISSIIEYKFPINILYIINIFIDSLYLLYQIIIILRSFTSKFTFITSIKIWLYLNIIILYNIYIYYIIFY